MAVKPTVIPNWATTDVVDPTSGQNNQVEPAVGVRATGFVPLNKKPERQFINWLHKLSGDWITYFDSVVDQDVTTTGTPSFASIATNVITGVNPVFSTVSSDIIIRAGAGSNTIELRGAISVRDASDVTQLAIDNITGNLSLSGILLMTGTALINHASDLNIVTAGDLDMIANSGNGKVQVKADFEVRDPSDSLKFTIDPDGSRVKLLNGSLLQLLTDAAFMDLAPAARFELVQAIGHSREVFRKADVAFSGTTALHPLTGIVDATKCEGIVMRVKNTITGTPGTLTGLAFELKSRRLGFGDAVLILNEDFTKTGDGITAGDLYFIPLSESVGTTAFLEVTPVGTTDFLAGDMEYFVISERITAVGI